MQPVTSFIILTSSKSHSTSPRAAPVCFGGTAMQPCSAQIDSISNFRFGRQDQATK